MQPWVSTQTESRYVLAQAAPSIAEPYVDAKEAGRFLGFSPARVREMAENGEIVAYNGGSGKRNFWRFKLSELRLPVSLPTSSVSRSQE